jgi:hypothetical protein
VHRHKNAASKQDYNGEWRQARIPKKRGSAAINLSMAKSNILSIMSSSQYGTPRISKATAKAGPAGTTIAWNREQSDPTNVQCSNVSSRQVPK